MPWWNPTTYLSWLNGRVVTQDDTNMLRDNFAMLDQHLHSGTAGDGGTTLGPLTRTDFTDGTAPSAPGAGKTRLYAVSGRLRTRAGASGPDSQLVSSLDFTTHGDIPYFNGTSVVRLAPGTSGQFLRTQGSGAAPVWANMQTLATIAETTLAADAANIDFQSIPSTYRTLLLVIYGQSSAGVDFDPVRLQFNGDTGGNYRWQRLRANNTTISATSQQADTSLEAGLVTGRTFVDGHWGAAAILIPGYSTTTTNKQVIGWSGGIRGGDISLNRHALQQNAGINVSVTAAINRVTIFPSGGSWKAGTIATLYGLPTA